MCANRVWSVLAVLLALLVLPVPATAQGTAGIDLSGPRPPASTDPAELGRVCLSPPRVMDGSPAKPPTRWPVRIRLLNVVPARPDGALVMVELQITADQDVVIPRSEDRRAVDPKPRAPLASFRQFVPLLKLEGAAPGNGRSVTTRSVVGSKMASDSLMPLVAGQQVRLKYVTNIGPILREAGRNPLRVRAVLQTCDGGESQADLESENVFEVMTKH